MKQKGFAPIIILLVVLVLGGIVGGMVYFGSKTKQSSLYPQPTLTQPQVSTIPTISQSDQTANWKVFKFSDKSGFGYELKLPLEWYSRPWDGSPEPAPVELAQRFYGKQCKVGEDDEISILHFNQPNPKQQIETNINGWKANGFTSSTVKTPEGTIWEKLTGHPRGFESTYYQTYIISTKGYYDVSGIIRCVVDQAQTFDQILTTFHFTQ